MLSFFYRGCEAVSKVESELTEPTTPKRLCKLFEQELFRIIHEPDGHFRQTVDILPQESTARRAALTFISSTLKDAIAQPQVPFDRSLNACGQFHQRAIKDRVEKRVEIEEEVEGIDLEEQETDNLVKALIDSLQPKYRNPGQAASSSNTAAADRNVAGPASRGHRSEPQVPEQQATEPNCDSGSDQTEQPPSSDISSPDPNPLFSEADLADLEDRPAPDVASGANPQDQ